MKIAQLNNSKELLIRRATENDAEDMIQYLNLIGGESNNLLFGKNEFRLSVEQEKSYINTINEDINSLMLIGLVDNQIVSVGQISSPKNLRIAHNSEIALSVRKDYWRHGIGAQMMQEFIQFAKENPIIKNVSLGVKASNHAGIQLYKKLGFEQVGINKRFFLVNDEFDDKLIMELYL